MHQKTLLIGVSFSLLFSTIFLYKLIININRPLFYKEDITWQYFIFDNNFKKIAALDFENLFQTRMFYPLKNTLAFGNSLIGQSLTGLPVYLLTKNTVASANSVIVINLSLAFIFMYLFAKKFCL